MPVRALPFVHPRIKLVHMADNLFNGSSISRLSGAVPTAKTIVEVRLPAKSMTEVLEAIHRLSRTGSLTVNFSNGHAQDLKWSSTRETKPPDV